VPYTGQPGSPDAAKRSHSLRIRSPSALNSAGGCSPISATPSWPGLPNTSGTSSAWQAPNTPPPPGASALSSYRKVLPPEAACACARCSVGIRNSQSEKTSSNIRPASASGYAFRYPAGPSGPGANASSTVAASASVIWPARPDIATNSRYSSLLCPVSSSTSRATPDSSARHGARDSTSPSATGENGVSLSRTAPHWGNSFIRMATACCASTRRIGSHALSASHVGGTPAAAAIAFVMSAARPGLKTVPGTLCAIALVNRPLAWSIASSAEITPAPADSPNTVTLPGSPPNRPMLSRTQRSAATASSSPRLAGTPGICANPSVPSR